jgi:hypothetical protein
VLAASDAVWFALIAMVGASIAGAIAAWVKVNELRSLMERNQRVTSQENQQITQKVEEVKKQTNGGLSSAVAEALKSPEVAGSFRDIVHDEFKNPRAAEHLIRNILGSKKLLLELVKVDAELKAQAETKP